MSIQNLVRALVVAFCCFPVMSVVAEEKPAAAKMTSETRLRAALDLPGTFEFVETPLTEVVGFLKDFYDIPILFDQRALDEAGIDKASPVTAELRNLPLRSALPLLLSDLELTWMIQHGVMKITTKERELATPVVRFYDVTDLAAAGPPATLVASAFESTETGVMSALTATVAPESWQDVGGAGSVAVVRVGGRERLVIRQAASIHEEIAKFLSELRADLVPAVAKAEAPKPYVRVYPIAEQAPAKATEYVTLIEEALRGARWNESQGTYVRAAAGTVVVSHLRSVQDQVRDLLVNVGALPVQGIAAGNARMGGGSFGSF